MKIDNIYFQATGGGICFGGGEIYRQYTGRQSHVLQSLTCLDRLNLMDKVTVKVPLIPGYNTEENVNESIEKLKRRGFNHIETIRYIKRLSKYPPQNQE